MFIDNWFLKVVGAEPNLFFLLQSSSFYSESSSFSRNIPLSSLNHLLPTTVKSSSFSLPCLVSQPLLSSSLISLQENIKYDYVTSTIKDYRETRLTKLSNSPFFNPEKLQTSYTQDYQDLLVNFPNVHAEVYVENTSKYIIPSQDKGSRATTFLNSPTSTLSSISWGLLLACSCNKPHLVVSQLIDILNYSISNDLLSQDSDGRFSFSPILFYTTGLPEINSDDTLSTSFLDNSLLGYSVTLSIHYLQSINYFSNLLPHFYQNCLELSKALCYVSAKSFDYSTGFCCLSSVDLSPDFSKPSFNTSVLASLLFNSYLLLNYDSYIHEKAAKLYLSIYDSPLLPDDLFYSIFIESSNLNLCVYKFWWLIQFFPQISTPLIDYYTSKRTNSPNYTKEDYLIASLINLYSLNNRPAWVASVFSPDSSLYSEYTLNKLTNLPIYNIVPLNCSHFKFDLISKSVFNTFAIEAQAYCSFARDVLISFLPEGPFWSTRENEEDKSTVIGSLIYAYSQSYFNIFLCYSLLRLPIFSSSGFILRTLLRSWFPLAKDLPEYTVKTLIPLLLESYDSLKYKDKGHISFLVDKLNSILKQHFEVNFSPAPLFQSLSNLQTSSYSSKLEFDSSKFNQLDYSQAILYEQQYKAIAFFPLQVSTVKDSITKTFNILSPRQTPGFPLESQSPDSVFSDDKYVLPLSDYLSTIPLTSSTYSPTGFTEVCNRIAPSGIKLSLSSNYNLLPFFYQSFYCSVGYLHITSTIKLCKNSICKTIII